MQVSALQSVVVPPILELLANPSAYFDVVIRRHCEVALVKQSVKVSPEEEPILHPMLATLGVGPNMSGFKSGERLLACNGASAFVGIGHDETKRALPESTPYQYFFAEAGQILGNHGCRRFSAHRTNARSQECSLDLLQHVPTRRRRIMVGCSSNHIGVPV